MTRLLTIDHLDVTARIGRTEGLLLDDLQLSIDEGEAVGLVGESGSGKSVTARSILRLHAENLTVRGRIEFDGRDVLGMSRKQLRDYRRRDVSMIFQDPRAAINPVRTIGDFLTEGLRRNDGLSKSAAAERAVGALEAVGISRAADRLSQYPHEFSGGMLQRVMICSTLLTDSRLLLADEPTTALDVTTQAEVVGLLDALRKQKGRGMLFITHDLDLAAALCDRVCVMYAGRIVENRPARDFASTALHPYSRALFAARPSPERRVDRLPAIPGTPITAADVGNSCAFAHRCPAVQDRCREQAPALREVDGGDVRCIRADELRDRGFIAGAA